MMTEPCCQSFDTCEEPCVPLVHRLREDIKALEAWVADLQSSMYVNCVYCGHRYGPNSEVPVAMAQVLKEHIAECPKHPMSLMKKRLEEYDHVLRSLCSWLSVGGYNSSGMIDPKVADEKIRWGVDHMVTVERNRALAARPPA